MERLFETVLAANEVLKLSGKSQTFRTMEMSLNKEGVMLDRSKLLVVKTNGLILLVPIMITRVEVRIRNAFFINEQPKIE